MPKAIARGTTGHAPQQALEDWSNDNNVFQFIRLEDVAYDKNDPTVVYIADTGRSRVKPDPATGRMFRDSVRPGLADDGRLFKLVFNDRDPRNVDSFTILADGDLTASAVFVPFTNPDNIDTSANSLMVQEDADGALIWRYDLNLETWAVVGSVNDPDGERAASSTPPSGSARAAGCWTCRPTVRSSI